MSPQAWTREQELAVLYLKVEYHGELAPGHTAVLALAGAMDRTVRPSGCERAISTLWILPYLGPVSIVLPNSLWTSGLNTSRTPNGSFLRPGEPT